MLAALPMIFSAPSGNAATARCAQPSSQRNEEPKFDLSVLKRKEWEMRKAIAELDAEQRAALIEVVDLGTALSVSGLIVGVLKLVVDLL